MTKGETPFDRQYKVFAGKLRRYHGESWLRRIFDIKTNLLNLRDFFQLIIGIFQSLVLLKRVKPDVILLKGGFVGVPVGLAAAFWRIPFVTHDSDAVPGLANRIVSKWARYHATGAPVENYTYPKGKTRFVGVLVGQDYDEVTPAVQKQLKQALKLPEDCLMLLVTGGSLGAASINEAMAKAVPDLLADEPKLQVIHQVGQGNLQCYGNFTNERLQIVDLLNGLYKYTGAADVVVTRAGANTLAELGVQAKAAVVVPNPHLTGGHQVKNAQHLADESAIIRVDDNTFTTPDGESIEAVIERLLDNHTLRKQLGQKLHRLTPGDATSKLAELLLASAKRTGE